ncbi:hypothetical protein Syun_003917 [Stephania yunnanensis]|uniref:Uncharacterized protein n=1 Tax=Stephania yunnanensis TaxID=152371 RepID=A0AAP0Q101_9MAGN
MQSRLPAGQARRRSVIIPEPEARHCIDYVGVLFLEHGYLGDCSLHDILFTTKGGGTPLALVLNFIYVCPYMWYVPAFRGGLVPLALNNQTKLNEYLGPKEVRAGIKVSFGGVWEPRDLIFHIVEPPPPPSLAGLVDCLSLPATSPPAFSPPCRRSCLPDGVPASLPTSLPASLPPCRRPCFPAALPVAAPALPAAAPASTVPAAVVRRRGLAGSWPTTTQYPADMILVMEIGGM